MRRRKKSCAHGSDRQNADSEADEWKRDTHGTPSPANCNRVRGGVGNRFPSAENFHTGSGIVYGLRWTKSTAGSGTDSKTCVPKRVRTSARNPTRQELRHRGRISTRGREPFPGSAYKIHRGSGTVFA